MRPELSQLRLFIRKYFRRNRNSAVGGAEPYKVPMCFYSKILPIVVRAGRTEEVCTAVLLVFMCVVLWWLVSDH